jgi:predicted NACHT family NTPase
MSQPTKGPVLKERVWRFIEALLTHAEDSPDFEVHWETDKDTGRPNFVVKAKRRFLESLGQLKKQELTDVIKNLESLQIWDDRRLRRGKGSEIGWFALKLWSTDAQRNREQFDRAWDSSRTAKSKALEANFNKSGVSKGATPCAPTGNDWHNICRTMLERHKRLTTNQLMFADEDMKFELDDIHVPLALVQRTKPDKCSGDISPEEGSRLYEPMYEEKQRFKHEEFLTQVLQEGKGQSQGRRIALIGEPGAGKTTLLQSLAFWILDQNLGLPIWISLADLQGKTLEEYLLQRWLKNALQVVRVTPEQENALLELCKSSCVWLLLDGVDEMVVGCVGVRAHVGAPLQMISSQLEGWVAKARVVLTCRLNVWEANLNALGDDFETYQLLDFDYPLQVQEFICRWFRKTDADKGERLWAELNKSERQRIQDLVKNPLRLALLCSTYDPPNPSPARRGE